MNDYIITSIKKEKTRDLECYRYCRVKLRGAAITHFYIQILLIP